MSFAQILQSLDDAESRRLASKVPSWAGVQLEVPASLNLQQCSGDTAARYKASLLPEGVRVADLTGGLGVDSWAFSLRASAVWYNERDAVLRAAVERNFAALGVSNVVFNTYDVGAVDGLWLQALRSFAPDVIYLDPARRDAAGRKVFLLEDCSPDVVALMPQLLSVAPLVIVKVSPMADITMLQRRLSAWLSELHVVGADGECKELLCICGTASIKSSAHIVLAEDGYVFGGIQPESAERSETPAGSLLFVPSAAMVKSGQGPGIQMMPYDEELSHFGKFYQVIENLPFASSVIKDLGRRYPQAEVTARGVQISSEDLRKKIRTKPGGPVHIFACIINGKRRLIITTLR